MDVNMSAKMLLFIMATFSGIIGTSHIAIAHKHENHVQIADDCRDYLISDEWSLGRNERCLAYRILITELNIGDQIHTKVDKVYEESFTLFNGFRTDYRSFKKSFMSNIRPNDKVILTKILPRHSACNLRSEIQHGLLIWNMKIPEKNIQSNFKFTYTGTKKFCGDSSLNYNGGLAPHYGSPETNTAARLLNMKYD